MNARDRGDRAYYSMPGAGWDAVPAEERADLRVLQRSLAETLDAIEAVPDRAPDRATMPLEMALRLSEMANRLFAAVVGEERDLRQVITTLRTALAVCWDMYGYAEAQRVSVHEHMQRLRRQIEEFENDLIALRGEPPPSAEEGARGEG